jgi:hypothetical protein
MMRTALCGAFVIALAATPSGQQTARVVTGRVIADENAVALPRARVVVDRRAVFSDDRGRFSVQFPSATSELTISKAGFATVQFRLPPDAHDELEIRMVRGAAISGRVVDPNGTAIVGATVAVRRAAVERDGAAIPAALPVTTDDLGEYRVGALSEGQYEVVATSPAPAPELGADQSPVRIARIVDLRSGDEAYGTDLVMTPRFPSETLMLVPPGPLDRGGAGIAGRVITREGEPVRGASVRLQRGGLNLRLTMTDADGLYSFVNLPEGTYTIEAGKAAHVTMQHGQQRVSESGRPVTLGQQQTLDGIDVVLPRGTAITGTVLDEHGEPIQGAAVDVLQLRYVGERRTARRTGTARRTDDYGRYRLFGLLPGRYLVRASVDEELTEEDGSRSAAGYAPVYFPGSARADGASVLEVEVGVDTTGVHLVFARTRVARISGRVVNAAGMPVTGVARLATSQRSGGTALDIVEASIDPDGTFTITNVPPGDYVVQAESVVQDPRARAARSEFGMQFVTVRDRDPEPLFITTSPQSTITGRVVMFGPGIFDVNVGVELLPADLDYWPAHVAGRTAQVDRDRSFRIDGVTGPARFVVRRSAESWYVRSIRVGGREVGDQPFDFGVQGASYNDVAILMSPGGVEISGQVVDADDRPAGGSMVAVFAAAPNSWFRGSQRVAFARASGKGTFRVAGLPPGVYWVAAVEAMQGSADTGEWHSPEVLRRLVPAAARVSVGEGALHTGRFTLVRGR